MKKAIYTITQYKEEMSTEFNEPTDSERPQIDKNEYSMCSIDTQKLGDILVDYILSNDS